MKSSDDDDDADDDDDDDDDAKSALHPAGGARRSVFGRGVEGLSKGGWGIETRGRNGAPLKGPPKRLPEIPASEPPGIRPQNKGGGGGGIVARCVSVCVPAFARVDRI